MTATAETVDLYESGPARRFVTGFAYPFRGMAFLLARPRLWIFVAVPIVLLASLLGLAAVAVIAWVPALIGWFVPQPAGPGLLWAMWWTAVLFAGVVAYGIAAVTLYAASSILSTPFYDMLAERVEQEVLGREGGPFDWAILLRDAARSAAHTLIALAIYAVVVLVVFLIGLVPAAGQVLGPILGAIVTATFLARELLDMPLARRRIGFVRKLRFLWRHLALMEGLGAAAMLLLWVPLLNLLSMPVAVVGGTLLYCRLEQERQGIDSVE